MREEEESTALVRCLALSRPEETRWIPGRSTDTLPYMVETWEYATVEWLWDKNLIRWDLPGGQEGRAEGAHAAVVGTLTRLGHDGWEVIASTAAGNWLFWTLRRRAGS
jgi:hypothetical protein